MNDMCYTSIVSFLFSLFFAFDKPETRGQQMLKSALLIFTINTIVSTLVFAETSLSPTPMDELDYTQPLLSGNYNPDITTPSSVLGFPVGRKTASPAQIVDFITHASSQSDRAMLVEYARSHEDRPLYYVVISSADNLARLDSIKAGVQRLSDPRGLSADDASVLINDLPAIAWMAYSIHGNETSGADSALATIYHLLASTDEDIVSLLDRSIVIIDPSQNPDGRARFIKAVEELRGLTPSVDNQSMLHTQYWPGGRYNHYLFDLNRDFIHGVHPETRGRVRAINEWHPQLVIDGHEMGSLSTYHFSPPRQPINAHLPPALARWGLAFAKDQARAFDQRGWPYFNGENYDDLYPGYTTYSQYRGALNILYEQARIAENGVRRRGGIITTYQESVHHQLVSTLTNLQTLAEQSKNLYRDYVADRRFVLSSRSPYADRNFVILPTDNHSRLQSFVDTMELQGFELYSANQDISVSNALTQLGSTIDKSTIPKGSIVLPNRQPEARLLATMLEFETTITPATLLKERQSILRGEGSLMYDVTAWNITMLHGLEAWTVSGDLGNRLDPYRAVSSESGLSDVDHSIGWVVNGNDDHSVGFAARGMELGLKLRVINKSAELDGKTYPRGSVVVTRNDNSSYSGDLAGTVGALARELELTAQGFASGTGPGDLPDVGGRYFVPLEPPRIAIITQGGMSPLDVGATWHTVDKYLGIRHSQLDQSRLGSFDLRRYNVLVMPDSRSARLTDKTIRKLAGWVENGGTLIAVGRSAAALSAVEWKFTAVRQIADTFEARDKYDLALQREWLADQDAVGNLPQVWANVAPEDVSYPWQTSAKKTDKTALKKQDDWQKMFMPSGVLLSARSNHDHWLTYGTGAVLPVLFGNAPVLMTDSKSETAVRLGVLTQIDANRWKDIKTQMVKDKTARKIGWSSLPDEHELTLRMSGLLWPEAAQRLANAAYLTREAKGNGQVILFADTPAFRGSTLGTNRLLLNALVYGPALGADHPIVP